MNYNLNLGEWNKIFAVPFSVVDKYIKLAKEDFIKVLLVLLAHAGENLSADDIAIVSGVERENVIDAISFWADKGVISISDDVISPADIKQEPKTISNPKTEISLQTKEETVSELKLNDNIKIRTKEPARLSGFEISKRIDTSDELKWIVSEAERMLGKFLTQSETAVIISMYDYASIPADVIVMIIDYCVSIEKTSLRYIEKTAYNWIDSGIDNHQKVEAHITSLITAQNNEKLIKKTFGIYDRNLTTKEKEFISVWIEKLNFSIEMIKIAYEMCVDNKGKLAFPYINKILLSWNEKGIKTPDDVLENEKNRLGDKAMKTFDAKELDDFSDYTVPNLSKKTTPKG